MIDARCDRVEFLRRLDMLFGTDRQYRDSALRIATESPRQLVLNPVGAVTKAFVAGFVSARGEVVVDPTAVLEAAQALSGDQIVISSYEGPNGDLVRLSDGQAEHSVEVTTPEAVLARAAREAEEQRDAAAEKLVVRTTRICPDCAEEVPRESAKCSFCDFIFMTKICPSCGDELPLDAAACAACQHEFRTKTCPSCGSDEVKVAARLCRFCRFEFPLAEGAPATEARGGDGPHDVAASTIEAADDDTRLPFQERRRPSPRVPIPPPVAVTDGSPAAPARLAIDRAPPPPARVGRAAAARSLNDGPLGQQRGIGFGIFMFIVTFGLYGAYWLYVTCDELRRHTRVGVGGGFAITLWLISLILIVPVIALDFIVPHEIGRMHERDGRRPPVTGWTGLWLFPFGILLVPAIIWWVKVQGALNEYWDSKQREEHAHGGARPALQPG